MIRNCIAKQTCSACIFLSNAIAEGIVSPPKIGLFVCKNCHKLAMLMLTNLPNDRGFAEKPPNLR